MSEKIRVLLSEEEVEARIRQIAAKISKDYAGKEIHLCCCFALFKRSCCFSLK